MFSSISWSQYFVAVCIITVVYYLYIGFKYYGDELNAILRGKSKVPVVNRTSISNNVATTQPIVQDNSLLGVTNPNRAINPETSFNNPIEPKLPTAPAAPYVVPTSPDQGAEIENEFEETETHFETLEEIDLDIEDSEPVLDSSIAVSDLTDLVDNLDNAINEASDEELGKVSMTESLKQLLEPHQSLSPGLKEKLSEHISSTTEQTGAPVVTKKEVADLWNNTGFFQ
jgi:hypothetical protein